MILETATNIRRFLQEAEALKREIRHSYLSDGREESVAEHVWRMSLFAMLVIPYISQPIHSERLLKLVIVHDLVEIYAGDMALTEHYDNAAKKAEKDEKERYAIERIRSNLPSIIGEEIFMLWNEYEANQSIEAKLAHALDKLEAQAQHNEAGIKTWVKEEYHFAFDLPNYTMQEPLLEDIAKLLIDEADGMISSFSTHAGESEEIDQ